MFIRKTTRRYKDKTYTNYLLAESVRTEKGPRQKTICSLGDLSARRGMILHTETRGPLTTLEAEVPLARMFGYATDVRSQSQGKASFTMEFCKYKRVPQAVQEDIVAEARKKNKV